MGNSILGHRVTRREDPAMLTVGGTYVDDIAPEGALFVTYVRSTMAHATITELDVTDAAGAPGVVGVFTADDIDLPDIEPMMPMLAQVKRPLLARGVVQFVGEPIAVVLSETREQGMDAAELVVVDYDPLEALVDQSTSLDDGTVVLHAGTETNLAMEIGAFSTASFDECEVVVNQRIVNQRVAAAPIEPRSASATWTDDGRLVQHISCQGPNPIQVELAALYGLEPESVRVVCPDVGGGFGAKSAPYNEGLLLGWLSRRSGRPVRWMDTRTENMVGMGHGRAQVQDVTIGGTRDGLITAYRLDVIQDAGAYPGMGAVLPWMTRTMATGVYDLTNVEFSARSVFTNTTPIVAYRGAGRPEAAAALERAVDLFAAEIGMDPVDVRRRNLVPVDKFPYTTAMGTTYDVGDYVGALDRAIAAAGYDDLRAEQQARRDRGDVRQLGIGIAVYVEITAYDAGGDYATVEILADGSARVVTGSNPYGQGHHTAWSMLVHERLGVPMDRIEVLHGDTDLVPHGKITGGSRSVQIAGSSIYNAAAKVLDQATNRAAELLEASVDDVVLGTGDLTGRFHVAGTPARSVGWDDLAAARPDEPLQALSDFSADAPTFPFGAHVAVVEVDTETGQVELLRLIAVDDAGTILNPLLAEGQIHGGLAQGAAQALLEEVRYDEDGNPTTANFADYAVITATELPAFERIAMETPTPMNELGAKGIGESGTIGATPAVQNAVIDALAPYGVRHLDMPATPERVWRAIQGQPTA
jgi:carbon-monoxide dehydrogenase large subunit